MSETIERFITELARVGGVAERVSRAEESAGLISDLLHEKGVRRVIVDSSLLPDGVDVKDRLAEAGFDVLDDERPLALKEAEAGITGVIAAVAESGSLLLGGPPKAAWQWASLLPPLHIALVPAEQIRSSLDDAFRALKEARSRGIEEFVWITGPSRTADIAITPLLGMHGPKELHAIVVP